MPSDARIRAVRARNVAKRARANDERGHRAPEGTGEVEDRSNSSAEGAGTFNCSEYLTLN
jgi:hypothetical protein